LVTEFDLLNLLKKDLSLNTVKAEEIMKKEVKFVREDTPVEDIILLMEDEHLIRVPVVRGDKLIGIVARRDILFAYIRATASYWPSS
jgi:CBS domain-containing protein